MRKNQIVEEQKHWQILHENDTKKEDSVKYNKTRVSIGDEYDRWTELKDILRITRCSANFGNTADL